MYFMFDSPSFQCTSSFPQSSGPLPSILFIDKPTFPFLAQCKSYFWNIWTFFCIFPQVFMRTFRQKKNIKKCEWKTNQVSKENKDDCKFVAVSEEQ